MKYDVVVIGAGASGMMAAIQAAKKGSGEGKGLHFLRFWQDPEKRYLQPETASVTLPIISLMIAVITRTVAVLRI